MSESKTEFHLLDNQDMLVPKRLPKIGVSGILYNEGKILLGKRLSEDTQGGMWVTPGGGIEWGETIDQALIREFKEETDLEIGVYFEPIVSVQERITPISHTVMVFKKIFCHDPFTPLKAGDEFGEVGWFSIEEIRKLERENKITEMTYQAIEQLETL